MRQTRHRSADVALSYLRPVDLWKNNVTETLFRKASRSVVKSNQGHTRISKTMDA